MRNPLEVLQEKEQELLKVKKEIEALYTVLPLLEAEESFANLVSSLATQPGSRVMQFP
jgi:hypothetical protein